MYLAELGYDPETPMIKQDWKIRLIYHKDFVGLSRDLDFMEFYLKNIEGWFK